MQAKPILRSGLLSAASLALCAAFCACLFSCNRLLGNPYLYNGQEEDSQYRAPLAAYPVDNAAVRAVPENAMGYSPQKFTEWFFKVSFAADNLPAYTFAEQQDMYGGRRWTAGEARLNENRYYAKKEDKNTVSVSGFPQPLTINPMTIYRYNGRNPLADPDCKYNAQPFMKRFYFYRIEGKAAVDLNQYLIAVDTYSKFVFAYGKIAQYTEALGQKLPVAFEAIELYAEKRPFWEYDPIGYVKPDGTVTLYRHYIDEYSVTKEDPAKSVNYVPSVHEGFSKPAGYAPGDYSQTEPVRSPYYPEKQ